MDKKTFQKKLGKRIAQLRQEKGMSQAQLGLACGKDKQSINKVEQGDFNASAYYLWEVCQGLGVEMITLFDL